MENIRWSSRWDYILTSVPSSYIQYFNLFFSCIIVLFLSLVLWVIICRSSQGIIQDNDAVSNNSSLSTFKLEEIILTPCMYTISLSSLSLSLSLSSLSLSLSPPPPPPSPSRWTVKKALVGSWSVKDPEQQCSCQHVWGVDYKFFARPSLCFSLLALAFFHHPIEEP